MASYTCKKCGPIDLVLHGVDERMHCLACDRRVSILTKAEKRQTNPYTQPEEYAPLVKRVDQAAEFADGAPRRRMTKDEKNAQARDVARSRAILKNMAEREALRRAGRTRPKTKAKTKEARVPKGVPANRMGDCSEPDCGRTGVHLLSKNPPRCAGCAKRAAVAAGGRTGGVPKGAKRKKKAVAEAVPVVEDVEVGALGEVLRAMRRLGTPERARVLRYAAEWCKAHQESLALPGPA